MTTRTQKAPFVAALFIFLLTSAASPLDATAQRQITVSGEGVVEVAPDQAVVQFGITTADPDPEAARARNARASAEAMNRVRALGIDESLLRLETLRIQPQRRYNQQTRNWEEVGFEAIRELRVTVKDLEQLPTLIAELVQGGANRLNGVTYEISDREAVSRTALERAAVNAREKADLLATTLGATLGFPLQISEGGVHIPTPQFKMEEMAMARSADAAPEPEAYASGLLEVRASVSVTFAMQ